MSDTQTNTGATSNNDQPVQPITPQIPEPIQREFINIDTAENSRINKGLDNEIEFKSDASSDK